MDISALCANDTAAHRQWFMGEEHKSQNNELYTVGILLFSNARMLFLERYKYEHISLSDDNLSDAPMR